MPEIYDVAAHFDDISISDAYTGLASFKGQFSSFIESAPDGSTNNKRILSVRPSVSIPSRRTISFLTETWIVGDGNVDGIYDRAIRTAYWMKKSSGLAAIMTPWELLAGAVGTQLHISKNYLKDTVNGVSDAEYDPFWDVFLAVGEPVQRGYYIKDGASIYRVRGTHIENSGFALAQCDQLDSDALVTAIVTTGAYDPVTDTKSSTAVPKQGILLEPSKYYRYNNVADPKYNSGDLSLITNTQISVGSNLLIGSMKWRVLSSQNEVNAWAHHIQAL